MRKRFSIVGFRFSVVAGVIAVCGCASEPKYDEPPKSDKPPATASGQPANAPQGQFGVRSDRADEAK